MTFKLRTTRLKRSTWSAGTIRRGRRRKKSRGQLGTADRWHTERKGEHERLFKTLVFTGVTTRYSLFFYTAVMGAGSSVENGPTEAERASHTQFRGAISNATHCISLECLMLRKHQDDSSFEIRSHSIPIGVKNWSLTVLCRNTQEFGANSSFVQWARLQCSNRTDSISLNACGSVSLSNFNASGLGEKHQKRKIKAAVGTRATNVVGVRATGVAEAHTTSKTAETRTRTNRQCILTSMGLTIDPQTNRDKALQEGSPVHHPVHPCPAQPPCPVPGRGFTFMGHARGSVYGVLGSSLAASRFSVFDPSLSRIKSSKEDLVALIGMWQMDTLCPLYSPSLLGSFTCRLASNEQAYFGAKYDIYDEFKFPAIHIVVLLVGESLITLDQLILTLSTNAVWFIALALLLAPSTNHGMGSGVPMGGPYRKTAVWALTVAGTKSQTCSVLPPPSTLSRMTMSTSDLSQSYSSTQTGDSPQPTPLDVHDPLWEEYLEKATLFDARIIEDWNKIVDVTLVFVGLIISVLASFVIDTSQQFKPDPSDITNKLLIAIYDQLVAQATGTNISLPLDTVAIWKVDQADYDHAFLCNALLYSSLGLCTIAAALALAAKLWVVSYDGKRFASSCRTPYERAKKRQEAYSGVLVWKMETAIQSLYLILLIALVVFGFFVHISVWSIQKTIGYGVGTLLTVSVSALGVMSLVAAFIPTCPYDSTFSVIIKGIFDQIHKLASLVVSRLARSESSPAGLKRWGWMTINGIIFRGILFFGSGSAIAWATITQSSAYYLLIFIPIAISFEYAMKQPKPVNHKPQKHRLPRWVLSVFIIMAPTFAIAGYFRNPRRYIIFVILYVSASQMSKSLDKTTEIDAIIWLLETSPNSDLIRKACQILRGYGDYRPKMLESLMPLLSLLIVSDRSDVELEDLETYVSFLAYLADFDKKPGSWLLLREDAMSHPRLEDPLLQKLVELKHHPRVGIAQAAEKVLRLFGYPDEGDTSSIMTFVEPAQSYEEMGLHPRQAMILCQPPPFEQPRIVTLVQEQD
ncbi:uncharacterized protein LACBIDRAFT_334197 [Laccaria bicolor S238N-H82]|uniref:Predicted protein n=1 Tax=Laccaria bicolor (strain S238N-H82 / ATCC MYA-4686) TaxID=486041 RepID=B0DYE8_LACBS|nr:uncharacterized protein LACBIDRAFT_334197 [Laccaria bicolor S238N-H82]EDR00377.1 predicted protein [Laccaria bicolor S238N-H82]|eukprot:XP_001888936.1 predicted protein [Laccaria bicolor S238N-H82]